MKLINDISVLGTNRANAPCQQIHKQLKMSTEPDDILRVTTCMTDDSNKKEYKYVELGKRIYLTKTTRSLALRGRWYRIASKQAEETKAVLAAKQHLCNADPRPLHNHSSCSAYIISKLSSLA